MRLFINHLFLLSCIGLIVVGCGGGGGSSRAPVTPTPPPPPSNQAPVASFTASAATGPAPLLLTVDATTSSDADGTVNAYAWDFGDGASAIGETAQHTYANDGSFTLQLTVTDDDGATNSSARTITVNPSAGSASLSGTINVLGSSAIDVDVNDRLTIVGDNNSFANAQALTNPVSLGGFANRPNTGANSGNLFAAGDPGDFYRVDLTGNEIILLDIAEANADLDMRLYDSNQNLLDSSTGTSSTETFSIDTAGTYFVEVFPFSGASNYILNIGQDLSTNQLGGSAQRLSAGFVPMQIILTTNAQRTAGATANKAINTTVNTMQTFGLRGVSSAGRWQLAEMQSIQTPVQTFLSTGHNASTGDSRSRGQLPKGAQATTAQRRKHATLLRIKQINAMQSGMRAEPNLIRKPHRVPNDSFYGSQWHYDNINLPLAWDTSIGSSNVIVAVIDTGVLTAHPDLDAQLVPGYDFISDPARANDGDGIDADPNDPGDRSFGGSSSFHGTHVAGTIAAESDNNTGVAGVAWLAKIMPMRALGVDGGTNFDVLQAMRFAAGLSNNSNTVPAQRADIINLSLGSEFSSQSEQDAITEIRNLGILIVASAGNESSNLPNYPAAYDGVVSVSATTITNELAPYSNFGPSIDVAAPGGNNATDLNGDGIGDGVISTIGNDGGGAVEFAYAALNGTSMSAPHVAGVMALMKSVHPALTPNEFDLALMAGDLTDEAGAAGRDDQFGYGLINAQRAMVTADALANGTGADPGPVLSGSASTLNFGAFSNRQSWTLENIGSGSITIASVTADEPWLTVTPANTTPDGLGIYDLVIDRTGLADGSYSSIVTAVSDTNDVTVRVVMQVASASPETDSGLHFVIVVDEQGASTVPADVVSIANGVYAYRLDNVPFGNYEIFAGTDSDDDNFLCDAGEACGAYLTLDSPERLTVNGNMTGLDFVTSFRTNLGALSINAGNTIQASGIAITKPHSVDERTIDKTGN